MDNEKNLVPDIAAQMREEFVVRSKGGTYIYLALWLMVSISNDVHQTTPLIFAANTAIFLITAVFRHYACHQLLKKQNNEHLYHVLIALVLFSGFHWGMLSSWLIFFSGNAALKWPTIVIITALSLGGSYVLSLIDKFSNTFVLALFIPTLFTALFYPLEQYNLFLILSLTLIAYSIYTNQGSKKVYLNSLYRQLTIGKYADQIDQRTKPSALLEESNTLFMLYLQQVWRNNGKLQEPVSMLCLSINNAKTIQEEYGMIAWQASIEKVVEVIGQILKPGSATISKPDASWFEDDIKMTSSIGAASLTPNKNIAQETLIKMAEKALSNAEKNEQNHVATWGTVEKKAS